MSDDKGLDKANRESSTERESDELSLSDWGIRIGGSYWAGGVSDEAIGC